MFREIIIELYLWLFKIVFNVCKLFPVQNKITFVVSFGDNTQYIYEKMLEKDINPNVVFLCKGKSISLFKQYENAELIPLETFNPAAALFSIYHLATSNKVVIDNYYGFLAVTNFKKGVECIQLWHAAGAIKKFGLKDSSIQNRTDRAKKRFLKVYGRFDKVIVGSDIMGKYFMESFNLEPEKILRTGIPRTDFFFNDQKCIQVKNKLFKENPELQHKKIILYAPTYRDNELNDFKIKMDFGKLYDNFKDEFVVLLRLHPAIKHKGNIQGKYSAFVYDYSSAMYDINELLLVADILITDYSSIPYEYSLLNKPMLFFAYDLHEYQEDRGLWNDYEMMVPGPVVRTTDEIINYIKKGKFNLRLIEDYARKWNKYSTGNSSENVVAYLYGKDHLSQKSRAL